MEYFSIHFFNILHSGTLREKGRTHSMDEFSMGPPSQQSHRVNEFRNRSDPFSPKG